VLPCKNNYTLEEYEKLLEAIDKHIVNASPQDIPHLFKEIPLEVFGELSLQQQDKYPNIKRFFPLMPSEEIQVNWTGSHGRTLLKQSIAFVKTVVEYCKSEFGTEDLSKLYLLDYGCGWGRLIRLFYKYIPTTQIYAVDAWEFPLKICHDCNVKANFAKIDDTCKEIPFNVKFDVVIAFSVFTHLSKRAGEAALNAIRRSIKDDGIFVLTVRPADYWKVHATLWNPQIRVGDLIRQHEENGFVFIPHNREPIDGDITFGDTTISIDYIKDNWTEWQLINYTINSIDPYQVVVLMKPR